MSDLPTPLVSATWLRDRLDDVVLIDARATPGAHADYLAAHLPGARFADLERDLSTPGDPARGGRHPLPSIDAWCATLGRLGVAPTSKVVVYDASGGILAAARAWWMIRAVGHAAVAVLDGGLAAARDVGIALTDVVPSDATLPPYPATRWTLPIVDADEVERRRSDPSWRVVDVRAPERFEGRSESLDPLAGHIAGAINLPCASNLGDGRFLDASTLRARFEAALFSASAGSAADVSSPEQTIVSCGSGVTACHTLLALELAGLSGAALYVGSWSEWCRSDRAKATGG
jgi:thiosulfate/3-mercaptopyruvate sulfurtransferase